MNYVEFITGKFTGKTVHIVGSGPSLTGFDYRRLSGKTIIPVNHAYKKVSGYAFKVAIDANFFNREDAEAIGRGLTLSPAHAAKGPGVINFRMASHFSTEPGPVYAYGSSGLAALSMALQGDAARVVLWGLDYTFINGRHHATQGEFLHSQGEGREHIFSAQASKFAVFPAEKIVNASAGSAITYFQKVSIEDALKY